MAQSTPTDANGLSASNGDENGHLMVPGKRKRDNGDEDNTSDQEMEVDKVEDPAEPAKNKRDLIKPYFEALTSFDIDPPILKRLLPESELREEPQAKRQKSAEPPSRTSIADKVATNGYVDPDEMTADIALVVKASLQDLALNSLDPVPRVAAMKQAARIEAFQTNALDLLRREKEYPRTRHESASEGISSHTTSDRSQMVLSLVGYAPQERRLFSSLPLSHDIDLSDVNLPPGVSITRVIPSNPQERTQTLGELFCAPRPLPPLQPPKQPKTQAKGNTLDFYHPHLADMTKFRNNSYFTAALSTGHYLDYSHATPSSQTKTKQRERAQSLAGRKPSTTELEMTEVETLFRGAFSSFAPCRDDAAAVVPSSVAGRMWWQRAGQRNFQRMIEVEYYGDMQDTDAVDNELQAIEIDEKAVQEAIDDWDETAVDPTLEDIMGTKGYDEDKEADEILDEVSDLIETLASYQRIRNLTLPNSQNRQSSDPVNADMLANSGPQPSEEEQATYQVLKAQLALIIKTLPPYAVAKLNGDQLDDLLISTKIMVRTDQYKGTMEEDDTGMQARLRAQQQAAQVNARQVGQRTPSVSSVPYPKQYQPGAQYATPSRTPVHPQHHYRAGATPSYQQSRNLGLASAHQARPQPNQYSRPNGYSNQYATQLAKAQTPYGHQSMQQYAGQQRPQYGQPQQHSAQNARFQYQQGYPHQPGTPTQSNYGSYTNGNSAMPQRTMSPQVVQRPAYNASPSIPQQTQRYGTPTHGMSGQMNRFSTGTTTIGSPGLTGYHTVIPEAQQQRILEQAKARVAAQERSAMFAHGVSTTGSSGFASLGLGGTIDASRLAAARASFANSSKPQTPGSQKQGLNGTPGTGHVPLKVTPVPVPVIPGLQQRKPAS